MSHRLVAVFVVVALGVVACGGTDEPTTEPEGTSARFVYAFDGDSMEVDVGGRAEEVRLLGINAPEGDECFGDEAREALIDLVADRSLVLVTDAADDTDRYGRLLRYVLVDGEIVNGRMLAEGYAVTLQGDHRYNDEFVEIGNLAADAALGMWAPDACGPVPPAGATIIDVEHDPPGPDDDRLNEEYVAIANKGTKPLDLAGWTLRDESSQNRYVFSGLSLGPGTSVTVRTGCGEDNDGTLYWCSERSIWSNGGDTAILQDRHGNVAVRWTYVRSP
ncbi:MAG: lamin tail domain-containing protein [Actinomycetota bacterium]|nr:lamin tail domain-containing protein [Actinomycetota bacterium]